MQWKAQQRQQSSEIPGCREQGFSQTQQQEA